MHNNARVSLHYIAKNTCEHDHYATAIPPDLDCDNATHTCPRSFLHLLRKWLCKWKFLNFWLCSRSIAIIVDAISQYSLGFARTGLHTGTIKLKNKTFWISICSIMPWDFLSEQHVWKFLWNLVCFNISGFIEGNEPSPTCGETCSYFQLLGTGTLYWMRRYMYIPNENSTKECPIYWGPT